jgi:hypothetical protein
MAQHGLLTAEAAVADRVVEQLDELLAVLAHCDDAVVGEDRTARRAGMEGVLEHRKIDAGSVADHRQVEAHHHHAVVAEREHIERSLQKPAAARRAEHDLRQLIGAEAGVGAGGERRNGVGERILRPPGRGGAEAQQAQRPTCPAKDDGPAPARRDTACRVPTSRCDRRH